MLIRDVDAAAAGTYDLIIVGGGIYGTMLTLEATARGLRPLLMERQDFGGQTSFNSFRLIHGGLRYLQTLDLVRLRQLVAERRWYLHNFPDLTVNLPCLMPLYKRGFRRRKILRLALLVNDLMSLDANAGLQPEQHLPSWRIVKPDEVLDLCPGIDTGTLEGAALWWEASVPDSQRLIMEVLRWSAACGAVVLNYLAADRLVVRNGKAAGVAARDAITGREHEFRAPIVINATGPWVRATAAQFDRDYAELFRPTIAWNILFSTPPPSEYMLALQAEDPPARTLFFQPFKGRLLLGTGHAGWDGDPDRVSPSPDQIAYTLDVANSLLPGLGLAASGILRVFSGLLSGRGEPGQELESRPAIVDHGRCKGVPGLFSVSGVKFSSARTVAGRVLDLARPDRLSRSDLSRRRDQSVPKESWSLDAIRRKGLDASLPGLRRLIEEEAVMHLDDLVLRRTSLWESDSLSPRTADRLCNLFCWDEERRHAELARLAASLEAMGGPAGAGHAVATA